MVKDAYYENKADDNNYFFFTLEKNNNCPAHFHKNIEILFVKNGRHRAGINGVERVLCEGEIAFSDSYDIHYYNYENNSEVYILLMGQDYYSRFIKEYNKSFNNFLPVKPIITKQIFDLLDDFYHQKELNNLMKYGYVDLLLGFMVKSFQLKDKNEKDNNIIIEILTYINENYKSNITLKSLSEIFGYSKTYFSLLFNKYTNMHFCDYVNRLRIANIKDLLINKRINNNTIIEIALNNGFDSMNTYYRAMKKFNNSKD